MQPQNIQRPPDRSLKRKRMLTITVSFFSAMFIAGATVAVLYFFVNPSSSHNASVTNEVILEEVASSQKLIEDYKKLDITSRNSLYTQRELLEQPTLNEIQTNSGRTPQIGPTNSIIMYTKKDSFATNISSSDYIQYERKDTKDITNDSSLANSTEEFLVNQKLVKREKTQISSGVSYTLFDSKNVICQISDVNGTDRFIATYGLSCVAKQVVDEQYTFINSLISRVPDIDLSSIKSATPSVPIKEGSAQLVWLTISSTDKSQLYYFATLEKEWEYIGKRAVTTADDEQAFVLPQELSVAIKDPKWNGFLTKYIKY